MKNANDENIVHSISSTVPTISLRFCSDCLSDKYLAVAVNYNVKDVVEYFAFVICTNCNYESEGGGIFLTTEILFKVLKNFGIAQNRRNQMSRRTKISISNYNKVGVPTEKIEFSEGKYVTYFNGKKTCTCV